MSIPSRALHILALVVGTLILVGGCNRKPTSVGVSQAKIGRELKQKKSGEESKLCLAADSVKKELLDPRGLPPPQGIKATPVVVGNGYKINVLEMSRAKDNNHCHAIHYSARCLDRSGMNESTTCAEGMSASGTVHLLDLPHDSVATFDAACCVAADSVTPTALKGTSPAYTHHGIDYYCGKSINDSGQESKPMHTDAPTPETKQDFAYRSCESFFRRNLHNRAEVEASAVNLCIELKRGGILDQASAFSQGVFDKNDCLDYGEKVYELYEDSLTKIVDSVAESGLHLTASGDGKGCLDIEEISRKVEAQTNQLHLAGDTPPPPQQAICDASFDDLYELSRISLDLSDVLPDLPQKPDINISAPALPEISAPSIDKDKVKSAAWDVTKKVVGGALMAIGGAAFVTGVVAVAGTAIKNKITKTKTKIPRWGIGAMVGGAVVAGLGGALFGGAFDSLVLGLVGDLVAKKTGQTGRKSEIQKIKHRLHTGLQRRDQLRREFSFMCDTEPEDGP